MKITVHIGSTKTGSSALQMHMYQARELLQGAGILYSDLGTKSNAHHVLFASAHPGAWGMHRDVLSSSENGRIDYFRVTFSQILKQAQALQLNHIVLSSEYWWGVFPDKFQQMLTKQFEQHDVRLVACLRRQDLWLEASYLQAVKGGEENSFDEWLEKKLSMPTLGGAHYLKILNHWNETLLPTETLLIPYEFADRTEYIKKLSEVVCDHAVGDIVVPDEAQVVNKSPNAEGVEALLKLNKDSNESEVGRSMEMSAIMGNLSRPENTREATLLSKMQQDRLLSKFHSINEITNRLYGNGEVNSLFRFTEENSVSSIAAEA